MNNGLNLKPVLNAEESELDRLYSKWLCLRDFLNSDESDMESVTWDPDMARLSALEKRIAETPPISVREFALKVLVADDDGDMSVNQSQLWLVQEAVKLSGHADRAHQ